MVLRVDGINIVIQFQELDFLNRVVSLYNIGQCKKESYTHMNG